MRFKINYGGKTAYDPKDFSRGKFECKAVFQTRKGMPVVATKKDLEHLEENKAREKEAMKICEEKNP